MSTEQQELVQHQQLGKVKNKAEAGAGSPTVWQSGTPHEIEISVTVQYVGTIDVQKETFDARLWLDVYWLPSEQELKSDSGSAPSEWDLLTNLQTSNAVEVSQFDVKKEPVIKEVDGRQMYHAVVQLAGTFSSPFDLRSFPFDCQKLFVMIEMGNINSMFYKPAAHLSSMLSIETQLCVLNEWDFEDAAISFTASDPALSKQGNRYAQVIVQLILPRLWHSFAFRFLSIISLLVISTLGTYSMDYGDVGDRLGFIFTLLLTLVAFELIVADQLPPTSYLTFFDQYYAVCQLIIFLNVFTVSISPSVIDAWGFDAFDTVCFYFTLISLVVIHLFFFVRSFAARKRALERALAADVMAVDDDPDKPLNIMVRKEHKHYLEGKKDDRLVTFKTA